MEILLFVMTVALACLLQAIVGFGSALIATPLALIYLDKETVVSSMLVIGVVLNGSVARAIREPIDSKLVLLLFVASLAGMPVVVWVLKMIPLDWMKVLVGSLVVIFVLILYFGRVRFPRSNLLTFITGFLSGLLNTSTSMAGPPVLILLAGQKLPKDQFRKTLVSFFFMSTGVSVVLFAASGIMTLQRAGLGLISLPFVFLAGVLGNRIAARVPQRPFEALALGTAFLAGLYNIISGLM
jgi:uncharacterized membrane protein YfcA